MPAPPVTITLKNGLNGYSGNQTFKISGSSPTVHGGPSTYHTDVNKHSITGSYGVRSFFKFDVSSIPSGATIRMLGSRKEISPLHSTSWVAPRRQ